MTKAIELCRAARVAGWSVIVGSNESGLEGVDSFLTDFSGLVFVKLKKGKAYVVINVNAVGVGAGQLNCGGLLSGEFIGKYNRLMEILREDPSIPFVSRHFRK